MNRRDLFILIFKFFFLCMIVAGVIWEITPQYDTSYNASLHDKIDRIESIEGPKIVLIGNSNVAFGFDSEMIETAFGMPVVNMGLHGGLGNSFHEEMAKLNVHEGDIYVVCHLSYWDEDSIEDGTLAWTAIEKDLSAYRLIRIKDIPDMVKGYPAYLRKCIDLWCSGDDSREWDESAYARDAFNEYGDNAFPRLKCKDVNLLKKSGKELEEESYLALSDTCVNRLNQLNSFMQKHGATLVVAGCPLPVDKEPSAEFAESLVGYRDGLASKLECEVISDYRDYCYDVTCLYDGRYHLNTEGAKQRTAQLISDLKQYGLSSVD